jgi:CheY-like chemotaxis protein
MAPGGDDPTDGLVTGEEIRELLADEDLQYRPIESAPRLPSGEARVLVVSRRAADVDVLRACIEGGGAAVVVARNPFTALDRMRNGPFDGVITDLDAWAQDGKLLFDRIRELGQDVPVLFVAERSQDLGSRLEERARQAGAAGLLHRPLSASEVESAIRSLISRGREEPIPAPCPEPEPRSPAPAERIHPALVPPDVPWLRLFHAMSRLRRSAPDPEPAARELAGLVQKILEPEAVGIFYPAPREESGQWVRLAAASLSERGFEAIAAGPAALDERRLVIETGPATRMVIQGLAEELRETAQGYRGDLEELLRDLFP